MTTLRAILIGMALGLALPIAALADDDGGLEGLEEDRRSARQGEARAGPNFSSTRRVSTDGE